MIDPNLPLELDDGTPVTLALVGSSTITVYVPKNVRRDGRDDRTYNRADRTWGYSLRDGIWLGGSREGFFVLRNVADNPSDYEFDI